MAELMKKMADEICGSLKLMRGGEQTERGRREGRRINSLFHCLPLLIKEKRLQFAEPVYSFCQRERVREQETDCEVRRLG